MITYASYNPGPLKRNIIELEWYGLCPGYNIRNHSG